LRATPLTAARPRMRPQNDPWEPPDTVGDPVEPAPAPPPPVVVLPPLPPVVVPPPIVIDPVVRYWARTQGRVAALDVLVPCAEFGALYVEDVNGLDRPIGCQEAYQLGQAPRRVYEEVPVTAATGGTRVLRALTTPGRFVLVPGSFRIGRYEPGDGDRGYRPSMMLLSTIDVDHLANSKCVFAAGLLADVSPADRAAIERELRAKHHPAPVLTDVTELPAAVTITWALPRSSNGWTVTDESTRSVRGFQVVLTTDTAGVLALQRLLATAGIHGSASFELDDGLRLSSALALELDHIVGPESTGPLSVEMTGGVATLRNHVESPVAVSDVLADTGADLVPVAVDAVIAVGASVDVDVPNGTDRVLPVAFVQSTPGSLQEVRAYVEDITFELRFLDLARTADNAIATLDVTARMADDPHEEHVRLDAGAPSGTVEFVTPLTRFAATRRLEIRVDQVAPDGAVTRGAPFPWDLDTQGNFVSLTPELVLGASSTP
jgi:hypothetical protein